ncbi:MAG: hypothetical protein ABSF88_09400 [Candidatus Aminicenantales bacterium]|jgi:hypothetical protein
MNTFVGSFWGRAIGAVLIVSLAGLLLSAPCRADDGSDSNFCERIVLKCLGDAIVAGFFSPSYGFPLYLSFCLIGYSFCERYVERYV